MFQFAETPRSSKKTNVRSRVLGGIVRGLAKLSPRLASNLLGRLLMIPPRRMADGVDDELRASAHRFTVWSRHRAISAWAWGEGPTVLLVHGWGGRGSHMGAFVRPLLRAGTRVVSFDLPAHGASGGALSSVVDMARAIRDVERVVGCVDAVVAHSAGGAATTLALHDGLAATRAVYVAPALRPGSFLRQILRLLRVPPAIADATRVRMERRVGSTFRDVHESVATPPAGVRLLVVHDEGDRMVPYRDGRQLVELWSDAEFITTKGLGHSRVLRDERVVERAVAFVSA